MSVFPRKPNRDGRPKANVTNPTRLLPFAFWEALRAATARRRAELVDLADLSPTLRRLLACLHRRCGGKRWCWPSLRVLAEDLGYEWPKAKRTMIRQVAELEAAGALLVNRRTGEDTTRGQTSSVYAIRYGALRDKLRTGKSKCHRGVTVMSPGGVTSVTGGCQNWHPVEMNVSEFKEPETAAGAAGVRLERTDGGGVGMVRRTARTTAKPSGWWAGAISKESLSDRAEVVRLFQAAVAAGVLVDSPVNRVRVVALALQARSPDVTKAGGYVIRHIEQGSWNYLSRENVNEALRRLAADKLTLTADELRQVRCLDPPKGANDG